MEVRFYADICGLHDTFSGCDEGGVAASLAAGLGGVLSGVRGEQGLLSQAAADEMREALVWGEVEARKAFVGRYPARALGDGFRALHILLGLWERASIPKTGAQPVVVEGRPTEIDASALGPTEATEAEADAYAIAQVFLHDLRILAAREALDEPTSNGAPSSAEERQRRHAQWLITAKAEWEAGRAWRRQIAARAWARRQDVIDDLKRGAA